MKFFSRFFKKKEISPSRRLTMEEIINETVEFYSADVSRRSVVNTQCMYNDGNGNHCAVGRCLLDKYKKKGTNLKNNNNSLRLFLEGHNLILDEMLQEKYRGHDIRFWLDLQSLHDGEYNWNSKGLTTLGQDEIISLIAQFKDK